MDLQKQPNLWQKLVEAQERGYIITTSGDQKSGLKGIEDNLDAGVVGGHAYSVLQVVDVGHAKLMKLRNPWGRFEWKGAWSDNSDMWKPELREQLSVVVAVDGVFWICFEDWTKHFNNVSINSYHDSDEPQTSISCSHEGGGQSHFICDLQAGRHSILTTHLSYHCYTMLVAKLTGESIEDGLEILYGKSFEWQDNQELRCDLDLEAGKYLVVVRSKPKDKPISSLLKYNDYKIFEFDLKRFGPGQENNFQKQTDVSFEALNKIMTSQLDSTQVHEQTDEWYEGLKYVMTSHLSSREEQCAPNSKVYWKDVSMCHCFKVENKDKDETLRVIIHWKDSDSVRFFVPFAKNTTEE